MDAPDARLAHRLAIVRGVAALAVVVAGAHLGRIEPEGLGDGVEGVLDDHHALGPAEAAEGRVGCGVGAADPADDPQRGHEVGVVDVEQRPIHHRPRQVDHPAPVAVQGGVEGEQPALVVEARGPLAAEGVAVAGAQGVDVALEAQLDRSARVVDAQGRQGRPGINPDIEYRKSFVAALIPGFVQAPHQSRNIGLEHAHPGNDQDQPRVKGPHLLDGQNAVTGYQQEPADHYSPLLPYDLICQDPSRYRCHIYQHGIPAIER